MENYDKFREQLELEEWPAVYMFKFIVPNEPKKIALVTALFDETVDLRMQPSSSNKYISITGKEVMMSVDSIIERYLAAAEIEGLIAL